MKRLEYDVLVVGAGPAGSVAARAAAEKGASVLMIEKRQEIGNPVRCGEGLDKSGIEKMGIKFNERWVAHRVKGATLVAPDKTTIKLDAEQAGNEVGWVLARDVFDKELALEAARAGADVKVKTAALKVLRDGDRIIGVRAKHGDVDMEIHAKVVIGADGYESQIGRWAGINTKVRAADVFTCYQYQMAGVDIDPDYSDFYVGNVVAPGGYAWVFPKGPDTANVGLGVQLSRIKGKGVPKRCLEEFVKARPGLAKGAIVKEVAGAVSTCAPLDRTVADGIMLVGDAARQIDPITGGGIINGGVAGQIAGRVAVEAIETGDVSSAFLQKYEKGWRSAMEEKLYRNFMAKEKFVTLSDDTFNKIIDALKDADLKEISSYELFRAVQSKYPELVKEFEDLLM